MDSIQRLEEALKHEACAHNDPADVGHDHEECLKVPGAAAADALLRIMARVKTAGSAGEAPIEVRTALADLRYAFGDDVALTERDPEPRRPSPARMRNDRSWRIFVTIKGRAVLDAHRVRESDARADAAAKQRLSDIAGNGLHYFVEPPIIKDSTEGPS
jgi:hypothetical protein